jgi:hypothetical protein
MWRERDDLRVEVARFHISDSCSIVGIEYSLFWWVTLFDEKFCQTCSVRGYTHTVSVRRNELMNDDAQCMYHDEWTAQLFS